MKDPNIKFYRHPYSGSQAAMCGQDNMTKLKGAYRDYVNVLQAYEWVIISN